MKSMHYFLTGLCLLGSLAAQAQNQADTTKALTVSGYLEPYYGYDFNQPAGNNRPGFLYSHNRHNEVSLNLGFVKAAYATDRVRANLALAVGTYMNANYAAEPGVFKNVLEANAGLKLAKSRDLWLDAGIFASHIGFESAVGKDNWTLTRSLVAENSPYYETGAKLTYNSPDGRWTLAGLVLNGWQQIRKTDSTGRLSAGTQITFRPVAGITLNSSTFVGNRPDGSSAEAANRTRLYHNLYGVFQFSRRWGFIGGLDYGWEQARQGSIAYHTWYTPVAILRYAAGEKASLAARIEYFADGRGVVTGIPGFGVSGYSLNLDVVPVPDVLWRLEGRMLASPDAVFVRGAAAVRHSASVSTALTVAF